LRGEQPLRVNPIVPQGALGSEQINIELIGKVQPIQGYGNFPHRAVRESQRRDDRGRIIEILAHPGGVGGHFVDLPVKISGEVRRVTTAGYHGAAGIFLAAYPVVAGKTRLNPMPVIHLGVIDISDGRSIEKVFQIRNQRVPA